MKPPKATMVGGVYVPMAKYKDCELSPVQKGQLTRKD